MNSNAAGQLLGYSLQFPRALLHLLRCSEGDSVSVEVLGDVATTHTDGSLTTEEDKSSVVGNPLTNRSSDLWKTLSNWVDAVLGGNIVVTKTKFILFTNQAGRPALVDKFHAANDKVSATKACDDAATELENVKEGHEIWPYYNKAMNENRDLLVSIIERFELQIGREDGSTDVKADLKSRFCPAPQIEFVFTYLNGWVFKEAIAAIANGQSAIISKKDFWEEVMPLMERVQRRELIDFTLQYPPSDTQIKKERLDMPLYLRQLEAITCDDDELIEAATDFIKANSNRLRWIEGGLIDEEVAEDFEKRLANFWKSTMTRIGITSKNETPEDRGKLVFAECRVRQELINEQTPPVSTVAGTYHALVEGKECGWHTDWKTKCT